MSVCLEPLQKDRFTGLNMWLQFSFHRTFACPTTVLMAQVLVSANKQ